VDVRVVAATNRDLWKEVQAGAFRADLYFRLNVVSIRLPPLRERAEDIPLLVSHFAAQAAERHGRAAPRFAQAALDTLAAHAWPGNVRELEHAVERLVLFGNGGEILHVALPENLPSPAEPATATGLPSLSEIAAAGLPDVLDMLERRILIAALQEAGGVQARAAKRLGISRSNLNYRVQRLGITLVELTYR
jgi:two-component system response regulator HydG